MKVTKQQLISTGWIRKEDACYFKRLEFQAEKLQNLKHINSENIEVRDKIYELIKEQRIIPTKLDCAISPNREDIVLSEIDRYGLPVRTVINKVSGLIRTDPYYDKNWLEDFYGHTYRKLYTNQLQITKSSFFASQILTGEKLYNKAKAYLEPNSKICEIGCGMGGLLLPFKMNGHYIRGYDLGEEYIKEGNNYNLNLKVGKVDHALMDNQKYDLIILSHLIEHIPEIKEFLVDIKKLLLPKGKVLIIVPGIEKIEKSYNSNILEYLQNAHCWHFTQNTLKQLLTNLSFNILSIDNRIECIAEINGMQVGDTKTQSDFKNTLSLLEKYENKFHEKITAPKNIRFIKVKRKIKQILKG